MMRDYQVGNVARRQRGWIAVTVVAVVLLAVSLVAAGLSQIGGGVASAKTEAPISMATAVAAAQGKIEADDPVSDERVRTGEFKVNLNTADASQLEQVPGLGKVKVRAILSWRSLHPFQVPADVMKVKGIGKGSYEKLKRWLAVEGPPLVGVPPKMPSPRTRSRAS